MRIYLFTYLLALAMTGENVLKSFHHRQTEIGHECIVSMGFFFFKEKSASRVVQGDDRVVKSGNREM